MSSLNLKDELNKKQEEFKNSDAIFGMTLLTNPSYVSSSRNIMFTSHLRQFVNLLNPGFPKVFMNYENIAGEHSTGYYKQESDAKVINIISKFADGVNDKHLYLMFTYDKKHDRYDVIEKKNVENLTEKYGYSYNTETMDSKEIGDIIEKDEVLYRSTSYDEEMNYQYGINATVVHTIDNWTIEDGIVCSRSFAKRTMSKEIETVKIELNDNDILCDLYGDKKHYKGFPDINENVKDQIIAARRRIHNNQLLYDLKKSNLKKPNVNSDKLFYMDGTVIDSNIYSNKTLDELEDNMFNAQIKKYLKMQTKFYEEVFDQCEKIINSGSEYSADIGYYYTKAKDILDETCAWREESGNVFSHIILEIQVARDNMVTPGSKITARWGNKGVIARIVPDEEMPFLASGKRVDLKLNALGVPNRLNPGQSYEISINHICNQIVERLKTLPTLKEKEKLLFDIIGRFNKEELKELKGYYKELSTDEKKECFEEIYKTGIYIHMPSMWEEESLFDKLRNIYRDYDWIKPVDLYINKWGRTIKIMRPMIVGEMYMIKLKQNSKKGFSARSAGSLSKKGLPEKSYKNKIHQDLYSTTPIRLGRDETLNINIGVPSIESALMHLYYRNSSIGRQALGMRLASSTKPIKTFKSLGKVTNRNAEILYVYFKAMGVELRFDDEYEVIKVYTDDVKDYETDDGILIGTEDEYDDEMLMKSIIESYKDNIFIGSTEEYEKKLKRDFEVAKLREKYEEVIDVEVDE